MHYYYYKNDNYQLYIKNIWLTINDNIKDIITNYLITYHKSLHLDEFQAYITTEPLIFFDNIKIKKKERNKYNILKKKLITLSNLINKKLNLDFSNMINSLI